jgi:predicted ester cyclase
MSTKENKIRQRRVFEEVFNKGNLAIIPEFIAPEYEFSNPMGIPAKGPDGFKQLATMMRNAFPDVRYIIDDMFAEGDMVATRVTMTGTFKGEMMGIAPTGKKITLPVVLITRWVGGKEVQAWEALDTLSFFQQLGIKPPGM